MPGFSFTRNRPAAAPAGPGLSSSNQGAAELNEFYGQMPVPATQFATSVTALASIDTVPSVRTVASNASIVDRRDRMNGLHFIGGRQSEKNGLPQMNNPVRSSRFQKWLIGPQVDYVLNNKWYIAYPAATVMLGGDHNIALSTKVDQLPTRTSGGPGPATMTPAPQFRRVQQVPRYSTMPSMYPTTTTQG